MKKVIIYLSLLVMAIVSVAVQLFFYSPTTIPTAVIAEKGSINKIGGQAATLLPSNLSAEQSKLLNKAYVIAKADGHKNPELVQSILLQETLAGGMKSFRVANPGPNAYFGIMQLKLSAARDVLSKWPELFVKYNIHTRTDDEVKANLILNDPFNIEIASKYLLILQYTYGLSGRELVNAYNRGPTGVKNVDSDFHYARDAEMKLAAYKIKAKKI